MRTMCSTVQKDRGESMEKIYKTMRNTGVINIIIGSVVITAGVATGILAIISGAILLKRKSEITF